MAAITDVLRRMEQMGVTDLEAHGLLGSISVLAPEALAKALNSLEKRRAEKRAAA